MDWSDGPLTYMPAWSGLTPSGVTGDATLATDDKGRAGWRAQDEIAGFITEIRDRPHPEPIDHH